MPVQNQQALGREETQPEEERHVALLQVGVQSDPSLGIGVLNHVGGVNPAQEPVVHAQADHAEQPLAAALKELGQRLPVPVLGPRQQLVNLVRIVLHGNASQSYTCAPERLEDNKPPLFMMVRQTTVKQPRRPFFPEAVRVRHQFRFLKRQFLQEGKLPFSDVLSAKSIARALQAIDGCWKDRIYSPLVTLWVFLSQVLSADHSCRAASPKLTRFDDSIQPGSQATVQ